MKPTSIIWVFTLLLFFGCQKTETPSFLHVEAIDLEVTSVSDQGTDHHDIIDARVYLNDNLIGIYEIPATVPIVSEGPQKITIIAGIQNNGINSARINYPFYDQYSARLNLIPGDTIDFSDDQENTTIVNGYTVPVVKYFSSGLVFWNERFEEQGNEFETTAASNAELTTTNDPYLVFDYNPDEDSQTSGYVLLTADEPYFEVKSSHEFSPNKGQKVYLELNYKTDCVLQVGVYENEPTLTKVYGKGINPTGEWSKIYIELTDEIGQRINATSYSIFIEGILSTGQSEAVVLLDNIKLVYPG